MQYLSLAGWFISLSIMLSRFIHVAANGRVSVALTQKEFCFLLTQSQVQMCSREISTESFRDLSSIHLVVLMSPGGSEKAGVRSSAPSWPTQEERETLHRRFVGTGLEAVRTSLLYIFHDKLRPMATPKRQKKWVLMNMQC